jgi:hypothetical protein
MLTAVHLNLGNGFIINLSRGGLWGSHWRAHDLKDCISKGCNYIWGWGGLMVLRIVSAKVAIIIGGGEEDSWS